MTPTHPTPCQRGPDRKPCGRFVGPSRPWGKENCRRCWLLATDLSYRALWGAEPPGRPAAGRCRHLGAATGATVCCPSCHGHVELKVLACALHGRCTVRRPAPGLACCATCPDRAPVLAPRHLLYHVYPRRGTGTWRWNVEQLRRRLPLFDGRRVVAVVTDDTTDPAEAVKQALAGERCEWLVLPNDPSLREALTLPLLLWELRMEPGITWYGHAKGVTRAVNDGETWPRWTELMYATCLDDWPGVARTLETSPLAGTFKKLGYGFAGSQSSWHYSGTFFWFRNADVFARDWQRIDREWWGSESWAGLHFRPEEAGCLLLEAGSPTLDLYAMDYLHRVVEPAFARWQAEKGVARAAS